MSRGLKGLWVNEMKSLQASGALSSLPENIENNQVQADALHPRQQGCSQLLRGWGEVASQCTICLRIPFKGFGSNQVTKAWKKRKFSFGCLQILLFMWLMFFNTIFFMKSGCLSVLVTGSFKSQGSLTSAWRPLGVSECYDHIGKLMGPSLAQFQLTKRRWSWEEYI